MEIRKVANSDISEIQKLLAIAFEVSWEAEKPDFLKAPGSGPKDHRDRDWMNRFVAVEDGAVLSSVASYDYRVEFDGGAIGMGGVGDVSTFPQYRGRGAVRACMKEAFAFMRERGQAFSYLYPFSTAFYGKLGYGLGCRAISWEIPMRNLQKHPIRGTFSLYEEGQELQPYQQAYAAFAAGRNMAAHREDVDWYSLKKENWKNGTYTYLYYMENGKPGGYFTMRPQKEGQTITMDCIDFVFCNQEAVGAMLTFMAGFAANYDRVRLQLPEDVLLEPYLWEYNGVKQNQYNKGMVRTVWVQQVLQRAAYLGEGSVVLQILDAFCPWNNQIFQVEFSQQGATVLQTTKQPDITLPVALFSEWILGRYSTQQLATFPAFVEANNQENLKKIFYKKRTWIQERF